MSISTMIGTFLAAMLSSSSAPAANLPMFDGVEPSRVTDTSHAFHCGGLKTKVAFRQEWRNPDDVRTLAEALRVTLSTLSVSGRRISPAGVRQARKLFGSYASVQTVEARCFRGTVDVSVRGMPLRPWIDYLEKDLPQPPDQSVQTIRIAQDGSVTIVQ